MQVTTNTDSSPFAPICMLGRVLPALFVASLRYPSIATDQIIRNYVMIGFQSGSQKEMSYPHNRCEDIATLVGDGVMPGGSPENPPGTGEEAYVTCPLGGTWRPGTARNTRMRKLHQNDRVPEKRRWEIE